MEVAAELRDEGAAGLVYRLIDHSFTIICRYQPAVCPTLNRGADNMIVV